MHDPVYGIRYIRKEYGDYFGISVAGYPEGHIDWYKDAPEISEESYRRDLQVPTPAHDAG